MRGKGEGEAEAVTAEGFYDEALTEAERLRLPTVRAAEGNRRGDCGAADAVALVGGAEAAAVGPAVEGHGGAGAGGWHALPDVAEV